MNGSGFPPFVYRDEARSKSDDFVATVSSEIRDRSTLFNVLAQSLQFPRYFGRNWDALDECMSDLAQWIERPRIVLTHEALPGLSRQDLVIYLSILRDAMLCLARPQEHDDPAHFSPRELIVAFPREAGKRIEEAWSGVKPSYYS